MQTKTSMGKQKDAYRPTSGPTKFNQHSDSPANDASMMGAAKMISSQRGFGEHSGYEEYIYKKMQYNQGVAINEYAQNPKKLQSFYKNMGRSFNTKTFERIYGLYQENGESMFEKLMPFQMQIGDHIFNNAIGEIGVLQDAKQCGDSMILEFQDRRFRVPADEHGWSVLSDAPAAASSAQGPALFKEDIGKGTKVEEEHAHTIHKIIEEGKENNMDVEKAAEMIAKDHLKENPNYYKDLKKGGKEKLVSQDDEEDEDEEDEDDIEFADATGSPFTPKSQNYKNSAMHDYPTGHGSFHNEVVAPAVKAVGAAPGDRISVFKGEHTPETLKTTFPKGPSAFGTVSSGASPVSYDPNINKKGIGWGHDVYGSGNTNHHVVDTPHGKYTVLHQPQGGSAKELHQKAEKGAMGNIGPAVSPEGLAHTTINKYREELTGLSSIPEHERKPHQRMRMDELQHHLPRLESGVESWQKAGAEGPRATSEGFQASTGSLKTHIQQLHPTNSPIGEEPKKPIGSPEPRPLIKSPGDLRKTMEGMPLAHGTSRQDQTMRSFGKAVVNAEPKGPSEPGEKKIGVDITEPETMKHFKGANVTAYNTEKKTMGSDKIEHMTALVNEQKPNTVVIKKNFGSFQKPKADEYTAKLGAWKGPQKAMDMAGGENRLGLAFHSTKGSMKEKTKSSRTFIKSNVAGIGEGNRTTAAGTKIEGIGPANTYLGVGDTRVGRDVQSTVEEARSNKFGMPRGQLVKEFHQEGRKIYGPVSKAKEEKAPKEQKLSDDLIRGAMIGTIKGVAKAKK